MTILFEPHRRDAQQFAVLLGSDVHTAAAPADLAQLLSQNPGEHARRARAGRRARRRARHRGRVPGEPAGPGRDPDPRPARRRPAGRGDPRRRARGGRGERPGRTAGRVRPVARGVPPDGAGGSTSAPASSAAASSTRRVITVFAAKGGCGKTTLATNIAVALAAGGARRVGLIDLDLAFGDVAIMLQLVPERSIADAVGLGDQLDETAVRALLTPYAPGSGHAARAGRSGRGRAGHPGPRRRRAPARPGHVRLPRGRHAAAVHRPRAHRARRVARARPADHAGHSGAEEPADHPGHVRPAGPAEGEPARGAQPVGRQGRPHGGRHRAGHPGADLGPRAVQPRRAGLDQPGRADHGGQPAASGEQGDARLRPGPAGQPDHRRAGLARAARLR